MRASFGTLPIGCRFLYQGNICYKNSPDTYVTGDSVGILHPYAEVEANLVECRDLPVSVPVRWNDGNIYTMLSGTYNGGRFAHREAGRVLIPLDAFVEVL